MEFEYKHIIPYLMFALLPIAYYLLRNFFVRQISKANTPIESIVAHALPALTIVFLPLIYSLSLGDQIPCRDHGPYAILSPVLAAIYVAIVYLAITTAHSNALTMMGGVRPLLNRTLHLAIIANASVISILLITGVDLAKEEGSTDVVKQIDAVYFSIITFTTVGFGDIKPCHETRLLAASHGFVGILCAALTALTVQRMFSKTE